LFGRLLVLGLVTCAVAVGSFVWCLLAKK